MYADFCFPPAGSNHWSLAGSRMLREPYTLIYPDPNICGQFCEFSWLNAGSPNQLLYMMFDKVKSTSLVRQSTN